MSHSMLRLARVSRAPRLAPAALGALRQHCQVPCGIFDDPVRVTMLQEDAATVRKAMVQIEELSAAGTALSLNQATRWVMTKEDHAKSIITTVSEYMLCQVWARACARVRACACCCASCPAPAEIAQTHRGRPTHPATRACRGHHPTRPPPARSDPAQRVKKELFESHGEYLEALELHHRLLQAAVKTKQVVDVAAADALDHAIKDVGAMYTKE